MCVCVFVCTKLIENCILQKQETKGKEKGITKSDETNCSNKAERAEPAGIYGNVFGERRRDKKKEIHRNIRNVEIRGLQFSTGFRVNREKREECVSVAREVDRGNGSEFFQACITMFSR